MPTAMLNERGLEPGVAPQLGEPARTGSGEVGDFDPTRIVAHVRGDDHDREQQAEGVAIPNVLRPEIFFPAS